MTRHDTMVDLADLDLDPYPIYRRLREQGPIAWIDPLGMWWVTGYEAVQQVLLDDRIFTTASPHSLIHDTFGVQMLTAEGSLHMRYRSAAQPAFAPSRIREGLEPAIAVATNRLIAGMGDGPVELRGTFASRLPIQTILIAFGLPLAAEAELRRWYDAFELALANFAGDPAVRAAGQAAVRAFEAFADTEIAIARRTGGNDALLGALLQREGSAALSDAEIRANMLIIFFGAISTVEALILNAVWALAHDAALRERVQQDRALVPKLIDETMRWMGPVQSATRHVTQDTALAGVQLAAGDVVNCMIAAANHDPAVFPQPERFDIDRPNLGKHLGFATGPHLCLGFRLAKAEARIALEALLDRFPAMALDPARSDPPRGFEFRQSKRLTLLG